MGGRLLCSQCTSTAWLDRAARERPAHPAVNALTYADLDARVTAAALELGKPGARVGIALPPGEDFVVALHATWRAGATAVPIDLRLTPAERPPSDLLVDTPIGVRSCNQARARPELRTRLISPTPPR